MCDLRANLISVRLITEEMRFLDLILHNYIAEDVMSNVKYNVDRLKSFRIQETQGHAVHSGY